MSKNEKDLLFNLYSWFNTLKNLLKLYRSNYIDIEDINYKELFNDIDMFQSMLDELLKGVTDNV